ncbi:MAG: extracellular solute-binding protein [Oscillospiraceae bacterium]|nr:extracellular solute-binding protein [Oscillospiraceae bacterium]
MKKAKTFLLLFMVLLIMTSCTDSKTLKNNNSTDQTTDIKTNSLQNTDNESLKYYELGELSQNFYNIYDIKSIDEKTYIAGIGSDTSCSADISAVEINGTDSSVLYSYDTIENDCGVENQLYGYTLYGVTNQMQENTCSLIKTDLLSGKREIILDGSYAEVKTYYGTDNYVYVIKGNNILYIYNNGEWSDTTIDLGQYINNCDKYFLYVDESGNIYVLAENSSENKIYLHKFDEEYNHVYECNYDDMSGSIQGIFQENKSNNIVISSFENESKTLFINTLDCNSGKTLGRYETQDFSNIQPGKSGYECIGYNTEGEVYGYNYSNDSKSLLFQNTDNNKIILGMSEDTKIIILNQNNNSDQTDLVSSVTVIDNSGQKSDTINLIKECDGYISRAYINDNADIFYIEEDYNAVYIQEDRSSGNHIIHTINNSGEHSFFKIYTDQIDTYPLFITGDLSGNIFIGNKTDSGLTVTVYDNSGNVISEATLPNFMSILSYFMFNDKLYINCAESHEIQNCYCMDSQSGKFTSVGEFENNDFSNISDGDSNYDIYINNQRTVCGYSFDTKKYTEILNWTDSGIGNLFVRNFYCVGNSEFIIMGSQNGELEKNYTLRKSDKSHDDIQTLTIGGIGISYSELNDKIIDFNNNNNKYKILCKDYGSDDEGAEQMNLDLLDKQLDVVISNSSFSVADYNKDIFADLSEFLQKDEKINQSDYYENIISLYSDNNRLYEITPQFAVMTTIGLKEDFSGNKNINWNADDFSQFLNSKNTFGEIEDRYIISPFISLFINSFVDFNSRSCDFNNQNFKEIITAINKNLTHTEYGFASFNDLIDKKIKLINYSIKGNAEYFNVLNNTDVLFKGYPSENKNGYIVSPDFGLSIMADCQNKDGAWEFIKYFLTDEYQSSITDSIPLMKSYTDNIFKFEETAVADKLQSQMKDVIELADCTEYTSYNSRIYRIIDEELGSYFQGNADIDETVSAVQSKVSLYLNETK